MRRKNRTTLMSTTIAVFVGLNMQIRRENRAELITLPLLHLTPLLIWAWKTSNLLTGLTRSWSSLVVVARRWMNHQLDHLSYILDIGVILTGIGLRSILYGLGAPL